MTPIAVLLVDDDPDDRLLTRILLDEIDPAAYHLTEVATYDAALDALTQGGFDVCLIDYRLGGRDGLDLLGMAVERGSNAPLIMLTGSVDRTLDESAMQRGAADYLLKEQITAPLLERTIRHAIERSRTLQTLRESEERFRLLVAGVSDHALFLLTPTGHVASWNAGAERMSGYTDAEIVGEHFSRFYTATDLGREWPGKLLEAAQADGLTHDEGLRVRKNGSFFWAEVTITALRRDGGQLRGYAEIIRDITDRREAAEQRESLIREQAARAEAEAATKMRDEFLSIAAHELKTPLTTILAPIQLVLRLLEEGPELDAVALQRRLGQIARQAAKLARMVNALLDLSRVKSGRLELQREIVDLAPLVAGAVESAQLQSDKHALVLAAPATLIAMVDALRLEQVLTNLLDNAIKYSPDGGQIEVDLVASSSDSVRLSVRDHGLGIPRESRARVFEQFFRAHRADFRSGMGIGLFVSEQIVDLHRGQITFESPADGGARFVVVLPRGTTYSGDSSQPRSVAGAG